MNPFFPLCGVGQAGDRQRQKKQEGRSEGSKHEKSPVISMSFWEDYDPAYPKSSTGRQLQKRKTTKNPAQGGVFNRVRQLQFRPEM
jgi:hypothetical protein